MTDLTVRDCSKLAVQAIAAGLLVAGLFGQSTADAELGDNLVADDEEALLVFARRADTGKHAKTVNRTPYWIVDGEGELVTRVTGGSYSIVHSKPGKRSLYLTLMAVLGGEVHVTTGDQLRGMRVDLQAGRTYVISVEAEGMHKSLVAVHRGSAAFEASADLLRVTDWGGVEALPPLRPQHVEKLKKKIRKADRRWETYTRDEKEWRNVRPEDGRTAEEMRALIKAAPTNVAVPSNFK